MYSKWQRSQLKRLQADETASQILLPRAETLVVENGICSKGSRCLCYGYSRPKTKRTKHFKKDVKFEGIYNWKHDCWVLLKLSMSMWKIESSRKTQLYGPNDSRKAYVKVLCLCLIRSECDILTNQQANRNRRWRKSVLFGKLKLYCYNVDLFVFLYVRAISMSPPLRGIKVDIDIFSQRSEKL